MSTSTNDGRYDIDAAVRAALLDELRPLSAMCRFCGRETHRGNARCGHCGRTLWRVSAEDQR